MLAQVRRDNGVIEAKPTAVPVHPADLHALGMKCAVRIQPASFWEVLVEVVLPLLEDPVDASSGSLDNVQVSDQHGSAWLALDKHRQELGKKAALASDLLG